MGLIALAAISGMSSAFAFNAPKHTVGTRYYGYKDAAGNARWTATTLTNDCSADPKAKACTITSTSSNVTTLANAFPAQYSILNGSAGQMH